MRRELLWIAATTFAVTICAQANDLPTKASFDRYQGMLEHSPFAVASAVAAPAATPDFAKDLYVANAAKSPDGNMVTIASISDKGFKEYLTTKTPVDGYSIVRIQWSHKVGKTKVTIRKDGQLATLTFNQMVRVQPLAVPPQSGFQRTIVAPTPMPNVRGVIRRNPQGQTLTPPAKE
jgi:hypothetical protein